MVTISVRDLLALSPSFNEWMNDNTRRKRVPKENCATTATTMFMNADGIPLVRAEFSPEPSPITHSTLFNDSYPADAQDQAYASFALCSKRSLPAIRDRMFHPTM